MYIHIHTYTRNIQYIYMQRSMSTMYALCLRLFEGSFWNALGMYHSSLTAQYSLICTFDPIEENIYP